MPRPFPLGKWRITGIEASSDPEFAPFKIKTNAYQMVETWELDAVSEGYSKPTGNSVRDEGYHLHWSANSKTTLGCGRVGTNTDNEIRALVQLVQAELDAGREVLLEVK
jgi:hypothetical protein